MRPRRGAFRGAFRGACRWASRDPSCFVRTSTAPRAGRPSGSVPHLFKNVASRTCEKSKRKYFALYSSVFSLDPPRKSASIVTNHHESHCTTHNRISFRNFFIKLKLLVSLLFELNSMTTSDCAYFKPSARTQNGRIC